MKMQITLSNPDITKKDTRHILKVLQTPNLSLGPKLPEFEDKVAKYTGVKYAVAVNSGTSALHLIIRGLGIGNNDEVITTPFSFISSANCILFERGKPVFVDIDPLTLNIDAGSIEKRITKKTKAILAVDVFGHPAEWDSLRGIARKHNLKLIEDSCEAIGAEYKDKKAGTFGNAGAFAFYPNKQITTGEGGVVVTNSKTLADLCRSMRNQGRAKGSCWLSHVRLGYNYRLSDINCALGIAQMERIGGILAKRQNVAGRYERELNSLDEIELPYISQNVKISWFVYVIRLRENFRRRERDRILEGLRKSGIGCSNYFSPIHLQPFYRQRFGYKKGDFPITESVSERTIALPFYTNLKETDINRVCRVLKQEIVRIKGTKK